MQFDGLQFMLIENAEVTAESSPAATTTTTTGRTLDDRLSDISKHAGAHKHWQLTGDFDAAEALIKPEDKPAESSPVTTVAEPQGENETESAPGITEQPTGKPDDKAERSRRDRERNQRRFDELLEEKGALKKENELLRQQIAGRTATTTATQESEKPNELKPPKRPRITDPKYSVPNGGELFDADTDAYEDARDAYRDAKVAAKLNGLESQRQSESASNDWQSQRVLGAKEYKDFDAVLANESLIVSLPCAPLLFGRKDGYKIAYYLGKNLKEAGRIAQLTDIPSTYGDFKTPSEVLAAAKKDPELAMLLGEKRALAKIELDRISESLSKTATTTTAVPAKQNNSSVPTSEVAVNPKGSAVEDELDEAVKNGDQEKYNAIMNRRDTERFRRGG